MMTNSIYGLTNYYKAFASPVSSTSSTPLENLIYSSKTNRLYMDSFARTIQSDMSSYLASLNRDASNLKSSSKIFTLEGASSVFNKKTVTSTDSVALAGTDKKGIASDIKNLAADYNTALKLANNNSTNSNGAAKLASELGSIVADKKASLQSIGITVNSDNSLSVDDEKLDKALTDNLWKVSDTLGKSGGITGELNRTASKILTSPAQYSGVLDLEQSTSGGFPGAYASSKNSYLGMIVNIML